MPIRRGPRFLFLSLLLVGVLGAPGPGEAEPFAAEPTEPSLVLVSTLPPADPEGLYSGRHLPADPVPDTTASPGPEVGAEEERAAASELLASSGLPPYPVEVNSAVEGFLERFTGARREVVGRWLDRSTRYLGMIREVFRRKGLPEDLAFTAMIESGFNPVAVSRAGAKGLWQFMERTALRYGLRVDRWVDERLDPQKSTEAAAEYLKDLFVQFGHWFLAQAAYNAGELRVARAVEQARSNDFWTIARGRWLREETKQFVPQIQAATLIGREPERYGFQVVPEASVSYELVRVPFSVDLRRLETMAGLAPGILRKINPELRRGVTPPGTVYELRVPAEGASQARVAVERRLSPKVKRAKRAALSAGRKATGLTAPGIHVVKPRETLAGIAKRYGVPVGDLARLNGLSEDARLRPGDQVRLAVLILASEREAFW